MPNRDWVVKALQAEGIPVSGGYGRLMYENPIFLRKIAYGNSGAPFTNPYYNNDLKYNKGLCQISEEVNSQFIWFKFINPPNNKDDMNDVIKAFEKIFE